MFGGCLQLIFCLPCRSSLHLACNGARQALTLTSARESRTMLCPPVPTAAQISPCRACFHTLLLCSISAWEIPVPSSCSRPGIISAPKKGWHQPVSPVLLPTWAWQPASLPRASQASRPWYLTTSLQENVLKEGCQPYVNQETRTPAGGRLGPAFPRKVSQELS